MSTSALSKLANFHQELFQHASQAAQTFEEVSSLELSSYSRCFKSSIPQSRSPSDLVEIITDAMQSRFLFFGDFHTLKQSQRGFLEILDAIHQQFPEKKLCVALEIFKASDQQHVDDFLNGTLDESHFLRKIDYKNSWGFPWDNYKPIVEFCSANKISVLAINSQFVNDNRLSKRDDFAAKLLNDWAQGNQDSLCLCLIGEYHLADDHLLSRISKDFHHTRVIANVDQIALDFSAQKIAAPEYFKLNPNFYCVINTAPWIKWNSLAMWEEIHHATDSNFYQDETEIYTEHNYDYDYHLLHITRSLSTLLDLSISNSDLSQFDLYMRPDRATFHYLKNKLKISRHEFLVADRILQREGFYYFSPARTMVIQSYSINKFAELAGHFLFDCLIPATQNESFSRRVESQVCATIAALLMNPRRPSNRIHDLETYYEKVKRRRLIGESKMRREAVKTAIPLFYELQQSGQIPKSVGSEHLSEKDRELGYLASRILGELIGTHLFSGFFQENDSECFTKLRMVFTIGLNHQIQLLKTSHSEISQAS